VVTIPKWVVYYCFFSHIVIKWCGHIISEAISMWKITSNLSVFVTAGVSPFVAQSRTPGVPWSPSTALWVKLWDCRIGIATHANKKTWLVVYLPLFSKYESQLGLLFPIYGKIKNVPNHQPEWIMSKRAKSVPSKKHQTHGHKPADPKHHAWLAKTPPCDHQTKQLIVAHAQKF